MRRWDCNLLTMINIERVLKQKGMTQRDLAERLGVTVQAVNSVVCGRSIASEKLLERYAQALDVNVEDLFDNFL